MLLQCINLQPLRVLIVVSGDYRLRGNDGKLLEKNVIPAEAGIS